jgi:hypothetical protein
MVEGKGGDTCEPGDRPRPFKEFLEPSLWAKDPQIGGEASYDLNQLQGKPITAAWKEIGAFGTHHVRLVHFPFGDVLLAEKSPGIFSPLMKWAGEMPTPALHKIGAESVLAMAKDFGGNVPMVQTWAWIWAAGPVRLDVEGAIQLAIEKVAPGHSGYDTGIDFKTLQAITWTWAGDYPGKVGVSETIKMWFELKNAALFPTRVEYEDYGGNHKVWRSTDK